MTRNVKETKGDCDCCTVSRNVVLYAIDGGMFACESCKKLQDEAIARQSAITVIEKSHKVDETIQLQSDIFNAATVSFAELKASIDNASDAPQAEKDFALFNEAANRIKIMTAAIVADEQALMAKKNGRHAWLKQVQDLVVTLRADYKAKAKAFDLSYEPTTPKTVKSPKVPSTSNVNSFGKKQRDEVNEAAEKYGINPHMVRITQIQHKVSAEAAARIAATNMGLLKDGE